MTVSYRAMSKGILELRYVTSTISLIFTRPVNSSKKKTALHWQIDDDVLYYSLNICVVICFVVCLGTCNFWESPFYHLKTRDLMCPQGLCLEWIPQDNRGQLQGFPGLVPLRHSKVNFSRVCWPDYMEFTKCLVVSSLLFLDRIPMTHLASCFWEVSVFI